MGRPKKNSKIDIKTGTQINGAIEATPSVFDELRKREFPYSAKTLDEYKAQLNKMNLSDLQRHAIEVAHILPNITDRNRLVTKLENEYLQKQASYAIKFSKSAIPHSNVTPEQAENIRKILNR